MAFLTLASRMVTGMVIIMIEIETFKKHFV